MSATCWATNHGHNSTDCTMFCAPAADFCRAGLPNIAGNMAPAHVSVLCNNTSRLVSTVSHGGSILN